MVNLCWWTCASVGVGVETVWGVWRCCSRFVPLCEWISAVMGDSREEGGLLCLFFLSLSLSLPLSGSFFLFPLYLFSRWYIPNHFSSRFCVLFLYFTILSTPQMKSCLEWASLGISIESARPPRQQALISAPVQWKSPSHRCLLPRRMEREREKVKGTSTYQLLDIIRQWSHTKEKRVKFKCLWKKIVSCSRWIWCLGWRLLYKVPSLWTCFLVISPTHGVHSTPFCTCFWYYPT